MEKNLDAAARYLEKAKRVLFITGAGLSADSGLPTYRGIGGIYQRGPTEEGVSIEVALSGPMFQRHPDVTWKYLHGLERRCRGSKPNAGHKVIATIENVVPTVWVLTQNVDGFHRAAGSTHIIDIHGDLHTLLCTRCGERHVVTDFSALAPLPRCFYCQGVLRPDVVLFGELLPEEKVTTLRNQLTMGFDLIFSVGTTSAFPYIIRPIVDAKRAGIPTVEINPEQTQISEVVDIKIEMGAATACEEIWQRLGNNPRSQPTTRTGNGTAL